jgi:anti-anti-sigma regulatory factor
LGPGLEGVTRLLLYTPIANGILGMCRRETPVRLSLAKARYNAYSLKNPSDGMLYAPLRRSGSKALMVLVFHLCAFLFPIFCSGPDVVLTSFFGKKPGEREQKNNPSTLACEEQPELSTLDFSLIPSNAGGEGLGVSLQENEDDAISVAEEAAMLYANGEASGAEKCLSAVLEGNTHGHGAGEGLWMMLISLYRLTGQQEAFEHLVLQYAIRFEKSPPPWEDQSGRLGRARGLNAYPLVGIGLSLSEQSRTQLEQMRVVGRKSEGLRIDVGRLRSVDETGATLLLKALSDMNTDRVTALLVHPQRMIEIIQPTLQMGVPNARPLWLLMLEAMQYMGDEALFEQWAVDYAVTFEESPPSWENRVGPQDESSLTPESGLEVDTRMDERFALEGEICANAMEGLKQLAAMAAQKTRIEVECIKLRRIDFVSAGSLFNILKTLQSQKKVVVLRNVNAMVAALLRIMGVDQVAQVMVRS